MIDLSIICCTYNNKNSLENTLNTVLLADTSNINIEFLIINNNSTDSTEVIASEFIKEFTGQGRYLVEEEVGLSNARNCGVKNANGEYIIFIDDDVLVANDLFTKICKEISCSKPDCFGTKIILKYPNKQPNWLDDKIAYIYGNMDLGNENMLIENPYISPLGPCIGFKRSVFDDLGLFDTQRGLKGSSDVLTRGEESEMVDRIRKNKGKVLYIGSTQVYHVVREDRLCKGWFLQRFEYSGVLAGRHIKKKSLERAKMYKLGLIILNLFGSLFFTERFNFYILCKLMYYQKMTLGA